MPCNDVTESIRIALDSEDRLQSYRLIKRTCGGAVGAESLLLEQIRGHAIEDLLQMEETDILRLCAPGSDVEQFLTLKHLYAIKSVLETYSGLRPGGADNTCAVVRVDFDGADMVIEAEIDVFLLTERIKSCAHCGPG